jgi:hypothetical protein
MGTDVQIVDLDAPYTPPVRACVVIDEDPESEAQTEAAPNRTHSKRGPRDSKRQPPRGVYQSTQPGQTNQEFTHASSAGASGRPSSNHTFSARPFSAHQNDPPSHAAYDRGHQSSNHNADTDRPSQPTLRRQRPQSGDFRPPLYHPRPVSPSVIDFSDLEDARQGGPPPPPESVYPDHEPFQTMPWLEIAKRLFAKHTASIAQYTDLEKGRKDLAEDLEECCLTGDAWHALQSNLHAAERTMEEIMQQATLEGDAAGWAYMMNGYMKLDPHERWTSGLVPLPDPNPMSRVYSALGTLAAYENNPRMSRKVLGEARRIVRDSAPASIYERSRLVLSQWENMVPPLKRRGFSLLKKYIGSVDNLNWSQWKRGTDDVLINRYFPDMAQALTDGRASFIPDYDAVETFRPSANFAIDDLFAESHPHNPPRSSQSEAGGTNRPPKPRGYNRGSVPPPSARQRTANPSDYSGDRHDPRG